MFKEINVIKNRGHPGTGLTTAPVWRTGGKPSTWFPPGTRRADSNSVYSLLDFFLQVDLCKYYFAYFRNSLKCFLKISIFFEKSTKILIFKTKISLICRAFETRCGSSNDFPFSGAIQMLFSKFKHGPEQFSKIP